MSDPRRAIPSVEKLLSAPEMQPILAAEPRHRVTAVLREIQDQVRANGAALHDTSWYVNAVSEWLASMRQTSLRRVINATGVVLHTNLGRAPLSRAALKAIADAAQDYSNLEYDIPRGTRGSRYDHCASLLRELTGAEAALVVNNNAAALVLALNTFAFGKYAIVSRGELVEIGGSFRIPEIMERSGARLSEIGSTNRTHFCDYQNGIDSDAAAVLKVHRSNFEMSGFVTDVSPGDVAKLASEHDLVFIHDLGSGLLDDLSDIGLRGEPTAREAVESARGGIVTLSGDKLLGGPQCGIILGSNDNIARMRANPLCRALRVDKLTLAALEATLSAYARGTAREEVPALRMLSMPAAELKQRATQLQQALAATGVASAIAESSSAVGGGAFPNAELPTHLVVIDAAISATRLEERLRAAEPPVIARVVDQRVAIDLRTVNPDDDSIVVTAVADAARE